MSQTPTVPDDQSTGSCVLCYRRDPHREPVCDACRSWLRGLIVDLHILHEQVANDPNQDVHEGTDWLALDRYLPGEGNEWKDAAPALLLLRGRPVLVRKMHAAPIDSRPAGPMTNRVPESRPPMSLDAIDLAAPARPESRSLHARGQLGLDPDQVGHLSLATVLDTWVRDWRDIRARGERQPVPTVDALTRWLADRADWACDEHLAVDEFAAELRSYRATLCGVLGLVDLPERKDAPCPKCDRRDLCVHNGATWVECGSCAAMMSPDEYAAYVQSLVTQGNRDARSAKAGVKS
jgi:hypothetical protein